MGERLSTSQVRQFHLGNPEPDRQPTDTSAATRNIVSPDIGAMSLQTVPVTQTTPSAGTLQVASGHSEPIVSQDRAAQAQP